MYDIIIIILNGVALGILLLKCSGHQNPCLYTPHEHISLHFRWSSGQME